jgi:hypothetical protein
MEAPEASGNLYRKSSQKNLISCMNIVIDFIISSSLKWEITTNKKNCLYCHVFGSLTIDEVWIGILDLLTHLYTLGSTSYYSAIADLHTLQITIC